MTEIKNGPIQCFDTGESRYYGVLCDAMDQQYYAPYVPPDIRKPTGDQAIVAGPTPDEKTAAPNYEMVGIIDSGVQADHPLIRPRIIAARDFTGEGINDTNGHGTQRTLLTLQNQPTARLVIAKVVGLRGGKRKSLIQAMKWVADEGAGVIWMALGEYRRFCWGTCRICRTANRIYQRGHVLIAAPGNQPGKVSCPAKAHGVMPTVITPYHSERLRAYLGTMTRFSSIPNTFATEL